MDTLNEKQARAIKLAIAIATLIFIFWFVRSSGLVLESMRPAAESGKLGNPAISGVLVTITELLVTFGGVVLIMATGLWRIAAGFVSPFFGADNEPQGLTAEQFVQAAIAETKMPPERRAQLQQALLISVDRKDWQNIVVISELLCGETIFKRKGKEVATDGA